MPQNDFDIANQAGAAFRADINSALQALATLSSGATAPSTTYARMEWADTTTNTLKRRNAANSGWIVVGTLDETLVLPRSSNTILDISDRDKTLIATGSYTQTFDAAATLGDGWAIDVIVDSGVILTLDPNSTETIDGATTKAIVGPASGRLVCNGALFRTIGLIGKGLVRVAGANGYGSTSNKVRRFPTLITNTGGDITYVDSATLGATFTINTTGVYSVSYTDNFSGGSDVIGVTKNANGATAIRSIAAADILCASSGPASNLEGCASASVLLTAGDVITPHTNGGTAAGHGLTQFCIQRVS